MRVAHLSFSGAFGGREKVAFSLVEALNKKISAWLYLVVEERANPDVVNELLSHLAGYDIATRHFGIGSLFSLQILKDLSRQVKSDGIELIHCHCHKSMIYAALLKHYCRLNIATAVTLHGLQIPRNSRYLLHHGLNYGGMAVTDKIIGCSSEIVQGIRTLPWLGPKTTVIRNNMTHIPNVESKRGEAREALRKRFNISNQKTCWVGNASRLTVQKNIPLFLQVAKRVVDESGRDDILFILAGDGELREEVLGQASQLGLGDAFSYVGFLTDMDAFYVCLDLFLLTSNWEGTPMALLEAMGHGVPVVATAVGGVPDVVVDGVTGLMCSPGSLAACTEAVLRILADTQRRIGMGKAGRQRIVVEFSPEKWVEQHLLCYGSIVNKNMHSSY